MDSAPAVLSVQQPKQPAVDCNPAVWFTALLLLTQSAPDGRYDICILCTTAAARNTEWQLNGVKKSSFSAVVRKGGKLTGEEKKILLNTE